MEVIAAESTTRHLDRCNVPLTGSLPAGGLDADDTMGNRYKVLEPPDAP